MINAIDGLMWYKLYSEHHYWTLWVDAIEEYMEENNTKCGSTRKRECAITEFSPYAIEVEFYAKDDRAGVCLRNFSWTPLGGWCLFRDNSGTDHIDTYRYNVYEFD